MKFISSFFSRTNGVLSEGMGFYSLTELYHDSVRDDEELFYNVSPTVSIHNFQKGSCKRKRGLLIQNLEVQRDRLFFYSEFTRKKTLKDSVFPRDLSTVSLLLCSTHNRDHCHFLIDLESITLALDSTTSIFSSSV